MTTRLTRTLSCLLIICFVADLAAGMAVTALAPLAGPPACATSLFEREAVNVPSTLGRTAIADTPAATRLRKTAARSLPLPGQADEWGLLMNPPPMPERMTAPRAHPLSLFSQTLSDAIEHISSVILGNLRVTEGSAAAYWLWQAQLPRLMHELFAQLEDKKAVIAGSDKKGDLIRIRFYSALSPEPVEAFLHLQIDNDVPRLVLYFEAFIQNRWVRFDSVRIGSDDVKKFTNVNPHVDVSPAHGTNWIEHFPLVPLGNPKTRSDEHLMKEARRNRALFSKQLGAVAGRIHALQSDQREDHWIGATQTDWTLESREEARPVPGRPTTRRRVWTRRPPRPKEAPPPSAPAPARAAAADLQAEPPAEPASAPSVVASPAPVVAAAAPADEPVFAIPKDQVPMVREALEKASRKRGSLAPYDAETLGRLLVILKPTAQDVLKLLSKSRFNAQDAKSIAEAVPGLRGKLEAAALPKTPAPATNLPVPGVTFVLLPELSPYGLRIWGRQLERVRELYRPDTLWIPWEGLAIEVYESWAASQHVDPVEALKDPTHDDELLQSLQRRHQRHLEMIKDLKPYRHDSHRLQGDTLEPQHEFESQLILRAHSAKWSIVSPFRGLAAWKPRIEIAILQHSMGDYIKRGDIPGLIATLRRIAELTPVMQAYEQEALSASLRELVAQGKSIVIPLFLHDRMDLHLDLSPEQVRLVAPEGVAETAELAADFEAPQGTDEEDDIYGTRLLRNVLARFLIQRVGTGLFANRNGISMLWLMSLWTAQEIEEQVHRSLHDISLAQVLSAVLLAAHPGGTNPEVREQLRGMLKGLETPFLLRLIERLLTDPLPEGTLERSAHFARIVMEELTLAPEFEGRESLQAALEPHFPDPFDLAWRAMHADGRQIKMSGRFLGNAIVSRLTWKVRSRTNRNDSTNGIVPDGPLIMAPEPEAGRVAAFRAAMALAREQGGEMVVYLRNDRQKVGYRVLGYEKNGSLQAQSNGHRISLLPDQDLTGGTNSRVFRWETVTPVHGSSDNGSGSSGRPRAPVPSEDLPEYRALAELNQDYPWAFWSTFEIRGQGYSAPDAETSRNHLRRLLAEKRVKQRDMGSGAEYRLVRSPEDFSMEDRRHVVWRGVRREDLPNDVDFRKAGPRTLERFLGIPRDLESQAVAEMMDAYDLLRSTKDARMTSEAILRRLSMEFPHLQVLTTTERLEQALGWLDLKGMAIRRQANRWWVGGQAATQYVNVDVGAWPPRFRAEWEELTQRPLSGWVVAQRIRLIMRMNGILAGELDPLATVNLLNWENGKIIVDSENFVLGLERWAERLGVDPIFLRTGTCRTLMEERVLPTLRHMTHNGRRLKSLRHLEGTTQKELAKESGVSHERIDEMEHGGAERSSGWERLGKGLGRSHFFILGGMGEDELMTARMPEYRRYHIIRQAYGLAQFAIADALGLQRGVVVDWDHRIPRRIAAEFYAWIRKAQSAKTTHQKIAALLARGA